MEHPDKQRQRSFFRAGILFCALFIALALSHFVYGQCIAPVIDFSFTDNQCAGTSVQFTSSVNGAGTFSYAWEFGDATTSTQQNPSHSFTSNPGNGTQTFNVKLTVTNTTTNCAQSITKSVLIKQPPDATINSDATSDYFNGEPIFKTCSVSSAIVTFTNPSSTSNANYVIDWGDGTPNFSTTSWISTTHPYAVGFWTLTYSITGQNGCSVIKTYKVFVGSNPEVSFGTPGNTDNCSPSPLTFPITGTNNNPIGTTYTVTYNDGSPAEVYNHPPPPSVTHTFLKSSCGITSSDGSNTYPNSFSANIVASNPCGHSSVGVVPIYVSTPPVANYILSTTTPITCVNTPVCFTNSSTGSVSITNSGSSCNIIPKIVWIITPLSGFTLSSSSSLGNDFGSSSSNAWATGTDVICPTFNLPGTYFIKMKVGNRCGIDSIVKTILVNPLPTATISGTTSVCRNAVSPVITFTGANGTAPYTFTYKINEGGNKTVTTTSGNSATVSALTGTAGTFNYNLVSVQDASTAACSQPQTGVATLTVKALPTVAISGTTSVCLNAASPLITFTGANGTAPYSFTYNINGGIAQTVTTISGNSVTVPVLTSTAGTFSYNLVSVQEGSSTACSQSQAGVATVTVNPTPAPMVLTPKEFCNGVVSLPITFNNEVTGTTYAWTNSETLIGLPDHGTGAVQSFNPTNTSANPIIATITVTPTANGCAGSPQSFTITVNPLSQITFSQDNQTICMGENTTLVTLNSATPEVTYNWISVAPAGISGAAPSGTSTIPVQTIVNSTNVPLTVIYKATASLTGGINCEGAEFIYTITVNPKPFIGNLATTACSGSTFTVTPSNGSGNIVPSGTTYTWSDPIISPAGALTGAAAQSSPQSAISQLLTNITNAVATATYSVTPMYSECAGLPFDVIVTVKPMPTVNAVSDISHCNGEQNAQIDFSGNVPGTVYNWVSNITSIGIAASGSGMIPAFRALNTGSAPKIAKITVTPSFNGCTGVSESFNITVYPILPVSVSIIAGSNNICPGTSVTFTATPVNGGISPVYQWIVNGTIAGTNTSTYTYSPVNGDTIKCQLLSNAICPSGNPALSNTIKMTVYSNLPANVTISASTNDVCPGESVTFTAVPFNEGFAPVYQWFVNGVKAGANQPVFSYNPVNGDVVKCQLTSSNTCSSGGVIMSNLINNDCRPTCITAIFYICTNQ